ncbi:hypothetical protein [Curtobacterium pusillum]|nr:hypothetical protein [Curtobacterium pusillum]
MSLKPSAARERYHSSIVSAACSGVPTTIRAPYPPNPRRTSRRLVL